jgi:hypothetical protein
MKLNLLPVIGVYIASKQLDIIKSNSNSATKLLRNLLVAFFTPQTLASSSVLGSRKTQPLDKCILNACFRKCIGIVCYLLIQLQCEGTARTILVDATNDKCVQCRAEEDPVSVRHQRNSSVTSTLFTLHQSLSHPQVYWLYENPHLQSGHNLF